MISEVRADTSQVVAQLRATRLGINRQVREGLAEAARRVALPRVVALAPSIVAPHMAAKASGSRVYITTVGPKTTDRIAGLLNFGGTVTTPIFPKDKRALTVAPGVIRGAVTGPRRYTGKHYIEKGIEVALPQMADAARAEIVESFRLPSS